MAAAAALVALLNGPWLRVTEVAWDGEHYTPPSELKRALANQHGISVLAVDTIGLGERLERIPSIVDARVSASLTGSVEAHVVEREVAFTWHTSKARFLGGTDGTLFAATALDEDPAPELVGLPSITDERFDARVVSVGDRIPDGILRTALEVAAIEPAALGSEAGDLSIRLDDQFGFRLVSDEPQWEVALGVYGLDPGETAAAASARLERQVTAVRTLFASQPETEIGWVDVRNPGKVYFRAKG